MVMRLSIMSKTPALRETGLGRPVVPLEWTMQIVVWGFMEGVLSGLR